MTKNKSQNEGGSFLVNELDDLEDHQLGFQETIDLTGLLNDQVSMSGSFDLRRFRLTSVAKLLEIIPIPAFLVESSGIIVFANRASDRMHAGGAMISGTSFQGTSFANLFLIENAETEMKSLISKVLNTRMPLVIQVKVGQIESHRTANLYLRAVRVGNQRLTLGIVEGLGTA